MNTVPSDFRRQLTKLSTFQPFHNEQQKQLLTPISKETTFVSSTSYLYFETLSPKESIMDSLESAADLTENQNDVELSASTVKVILSKIESEAMKRVEDGFNR